MRIKLWIPLVILFSLFALLAYELFHATPGELPSALIGEDIPSFKLPVQGDRSLFLTEKTLRGHVSLVVVWASWCRACAVEQPILMKIAKRDHVPIYGIDYKDEPDKATAWLQKNGNPFVMIGRDEQGDVAIDWGVYGTPETFIVSAQGKIVDRHIGVITQADWDHVLYPLVKKYRDMK